MPSLSFLRPRKRTSPQGSDNKSPIPLSGDIRRMAKRISPPPASAAGAAGRNGRLIAHTPGLSSSSRSSMDEPPAPTIATGPASGEVAKKAILADSSAAQKARRRDRFRMFRSRSTQFRNELGENVDQGEARRSWTVGMTPQFRDDPAIGSQAQTRPRDSSPGNVKYGNATPTEMETTPVPVTAQQQQQRPREPRPRETRTQPRPRPNTIVIVGDDASPIEGNSSGSGGGSRLEKLKRLPSLSVSVKRGLSTRRKLSKKLETPQVIVTPATVVSSNCFPFLQTVLLAGGAHYWGNTSVQQKEEEKKIPQKFPNFPSIPRLPRWRRTGAPRGRLVQCLPNVWPVTAINPPVSRVSPDPTFPGFHQPTWAVAGRRH